MGISNRKLTSFGETEKMKNNHNNSVSSAMLCCVLNDSCVYVVSCAHNNFVPTIPWKKTRKTYFQHYKQTCTHIHTLSLAPKPRHTFGQKSIREFEVEWQPFAIVKIQIVSEAMYWLGGKWVKREKPRPERLNPRHTFSWPYTMFTCDSQCTHVNQIIC